MLCRAKLIKEARAMHRCAEECKGQKGADGLLKKWNHLNSLVPEEVQKAIIIPIFATSSPVFAALSLSRPCFSSSCIFVDLLFIEPLSVLWTKCQPTKTDDKVSSKSSRPGFNSRSH